MRRCCKPWACAADSGALWGKANGAYMDSQQRTSDVAGGLGAVSKVLRMVLQSAVLAVGAYLVVQGQATGGIMIASSILASRALAPVELAIAHWRGFVGARQSWGRLEDLLAKLPAEAPPMELPAPKASFQVEGVSLAPPSDNRLIVQDVSFTLKQVRAWASSARARPASRPWRGRSWVSGSPARGKVRLDGAALEQWSSEQLGRHIGYLPQDVELFEGTVAQNIARFHRDIDPRAVVAAADDRRRA